MEVYNDACKVELVSSESKEEAIEKISKDLAMFLKEKLNEINEVNIYVSGGNTPLLIYEKLLLNQDFVTYASRCRFIMVDERYLDFIDKNNNSGQCWRHFVRNVNCLEYIYPKTNFSLKESVLDWDDKLKILYNKTIHLSILGTASDGHVASVFPMSEVLVQGDYCFSCHVPKVGERLSLTMDALNKSEEHWVIALGKEKESIAEMAKENNNSKMPIFQLSSKKSIKWYVSKN
ncbi:6-phosphogluconolactonase [Vibrio sinaloensis]|uniref:6-phosphogluconolactonase n=1 Tax=Photobacterium sp. (strain ATCC 43367) TaxID=379097 RepID=UPI00205A6CCC|nr:6-phosphogluconolactonase [Vibrio sinaloensis]UPQ88105.1 6-phosphogluconolactonase [Vibrio sinaloensis]